MVRTTLATHMLLPNPNCYSGVTLEGVNAESEMIDGKELGNWR